MNTSNLAQERVRMLVSFALNKGLDAEHCLESSGLTSCQLDSDSGSVLSKNAERKKPIEASHELRLLRSIVLELCSNSGLISNSVQYSSPTTKHVHEDSRSATLSPFSLGYELGSQIRYNQLSYFTDSLSAKQSLTDMLVNLNESASTLFSYSRFRFSMSGMQLKISLDIDDEILQGYEDEHGVPLLKPFLMGRNFGLFIAIHRALLYGDIDSVDELCLGMPESGETRCFLDQVPKALRKTGPRAYVLIDVQRLNFRHFLLNQLVQQLAPQEPFKKRDKPISQEEPSFPTSASVSQLIWEVFDAHESFELSKEAVARSLNLSSRTLSRRLQEEGTHWRRLMADLRIKKAKVLLENSHSSIQQVADRVGFSSASAFSVAFAKSLGVSPLEYRKRLNFIDELQLVDRFVGRDVELKKLREGLAKARRGRPHVVLISGEAGVGKTALLRRFFEGLPKDCNKFIAGKYDQYRQEAPLSSIGKSFSELINSILAQGPKATERWRSAWQKEIGIYENALIKRFPQFKLILNADSASGSHSKKSDSKTSNVKESNAKLWGPNCDFSNDASMDEYQHFVEAFVGLIRASATSVHPLVLFVDDLQWADYGTLALMKKVLIEYQDLPLLLVATSRTVNASLAGLLEQITHQIVEEGVSLTPLFLSNFDRTKLALYLSEVIGQTASEELVLYCQQRTGGNPFYLSCLLKALVEQRVLVPDAERFLWHFHEKKAKDQVFEMGLPQILNQRLSTLSGNALRVAQLTALLGDQSHPQDVRKLAGLSDTEFQRAIDLLHQSEVLKASTADDCEAPPIDHMSCLSFVHDKMQETVVAHLQQEEKLNYHIRIVRYYLSQVVLRSELLFEALDHASFVEPYLTLDEQEHLIDLAYRAARKSATSGDWCKARDLSEFGRRLLGENAWQSHHEIMTKLTLTYCESLCFLADYEAATKAIEESLESMSDQLSRARIRGLELTHMTLQGQLQQALQSGLEGLAELGVELRPDRIDLPKHMAKMQQNLLSYSEMSLEELSARPTSRDEAYMAISQLAKGCAPAAFLTGRMDIYTSLVLYSASHSLEHGYTVGSSLNFAAVAPVLPTRYADFSHRLGKLSLRLSRRFNNAKARVESLLVYAIYASSWRDRYRDTEALFMEALRIGPKSGDRLFLSYCPAHLSQLTLFGGRGLSIVSALCQHYMPLMSKLKVASNHEILRLTLALSESLQGHHSNSDSFYDLVKDMLSNCADDSANLHQHSFIASTSLFHAVMMKDYQQAESLVSDTWNTMYMHEKQFYEPERLFLVGMTLVERTIEARTTEEDLTRVRHCLTELAKWADVSKDNHRAKYLLLKAQVLSREGKTSEARLIYDDAIEQAYADGFVHLEALAAENCAAMLVAQNKKRAAQRYLIQSIESYKKWGAKGAVRRLNRIYEPLLKLDKNEGEVAEANAFTDLPTLMLDHSLENID